MNSESLRCVCLSAHAGLFLVKCVSGLNVVEVLCSVCALARTWLYRKMLVEKVVKRFHFSIWKLTYDRVF